MYKALYNVQWRKGDTHAAEFPGSKRGDGLMSNREGRRRTQAELPIETREAMKEQDMPMWKVMDQAVRMYLGLDEGSTEHALKRRIDELKDDRDGLVEQRDELNKQIENVDEQIGDLEQQLKKVREKKASYKEQLDTILDEMLENPDRNVLAWMSEIRDAATDEYGRDTKSNIDRVISDLQNRREERALAIEEFRFNRVGTAPGPSTAQASTDGGSDEVELNTDTEQILNKMESDD